MFHRFLFFEDKTLLIIRVYGRTDRMGIRSRIARFVSDPRWKSGYKVLVDYSRVTAIETPRGYFDTLESLLREIPEDRLPLGIAYVFPERLFHTYIDPILSMFHIQVGFHVSFFREEEEALEWLEGLSPAPKTSAATPR
jgi:hypothetical protein